jgi:hypothetical protein
MGRAGQSASRYSEPDSGKREFQKRRQIEENQRKGIKTNFRTSDDGSSNDGRNTGVSGSSGRGD